MKSSVRWSTLTLVGENSAALLNRPVYGIRPRGCSGCAPTASGAGSTATSARARPTRRSSVSAPPGVDTVTWGEFIEAGYLREYRAKQVTLQYLRPVIGFLRDRLQVQYPLATLKPYTSGRELAPRSAGVRRPRPRTEHRHPRPQRHTDAVGLAVAFLDKVEFNDAGDVAERLFPLGRNKPIVLDPTRSFGEPTVPIAGVRTEIIAELVGAGEEPDRVAEIYSISAADVEQVLDFERHHGELRQAA
jgi:uncharacterized protein (DUF433 family)